MVLTFNALLFQAERLQASFHALLVYARMLTCILSSASFATHLDVFLKAEMFSAVIPKFIDKRVYQAFAEKEDIGFEGNTAKVNKVAPSDQNDLGLSESFDYPEVGNTTFW